MLFEVFRAKKQSRERTSSRLLILNGGVSPKNLWTRAAFCSCDLDACHFPRRFRPRSPIPNPTPWTRRTSIPLHVLNHPRHCIPLQISHFPPENNHKLKEIQPLKSSIQEGYKTLNWTNWIIPSKYANKTMQSKSLHLVSWINWLNKLARGHQWKSSPDQKVSYKTSQPYHLKLSSLSFRNLKCMKSRSLNFHSKAAV